MTSTEYDPELYHLLHRGNPGDLRWYRQRCAGAQRILELGCGDGRLLVPLAQDGAQVVGVDASEAMLARCAERFHRAGLRAELVCGVSSITPAPLPSGLGIVGTGLVLGSLSEMACLL